MTTNQLIAVFAVLAMLGGFLMLGRVEPAVAHDPSGQPASACGGSCSLLPPTEDPEVARMHATALIVSTYIQVEDGNATVAEVQTLAEETADALR